VDPPPAERPAPAPVEPPAAERPAAPAPDRSAAPLDAAAVRRAWPEVLAQAKERKKRTAALLVSATVRAVEGDTLVLSIGTAPLARLLSEQSNTDVIAESLHAVLGVHWRVRCEHGDGGGAAPPPAPPRTDPPRGDSGPAREVPGRRPPEQPGQRRPVRPPPTRRSAPDDGVPLPPEPADEDAPPDDEEAMMATVTDVGASVAQRDPEEAAMELLSAQLGARALDQPRA
jgi:DNA polymerase-3 subunit gamma/tau